MDQTTLKQLVTVDNQGRFISLVNRGKRVKVGDVLGSMRPDGYIKLMINGSNYLAHRLMWLYVYGTWPEEQIDHIDKNKANNHISNLQECSDAENKQNRTKQKNNKTGHTGVIWDAGNQKWRVQISVNRTTIFVGRFADYNTACDEYVKAKAKHHTYCPVAV